MSTLIRLRSSTTFFTTRVPSRFYSILLKLLILFFVITTLYFNSNPEKFQINCKHENDKRNVQQVQKARGWSQGDISEYLSKHSNDNWIIVCFSNKNYIEIVKIWYKQLEMLGYTNHFIVAMDSETYDILTENNEHRVIKSIRPFNSSYQNLQNLWAIRLRTIHQLLSLNFNVLSSDSDAIWKKYVDLNSLPKNYNIIHAYDRGYPKNAYQHFGFVVTGGIGGYIYSEATIQLLEKFMQACSDECDDQAVINNFYMKSGFVFNKVDRIDYEEGGNDKVNRTGVSLDGKFKVFVFETDICLRGNNPTYCYKKEWEKLWLYSPQAEKTGSSKLEMLKKYSNCFKEGVLEE